VGFEILFFAAERRKEGSQWQAQRSLWLQDDHAPRVEDAPLKTT